jgi:tetratricopeptide (TPR) repeat protein
MVFFASVVMAAALFCTESRGGMFSFIVALIFMTILVFFKRSLRKKTWILGVTAAGIGLTLLWIGITPIIQRIATIQVEVTSRYFGGRLRIWQTALGIIRDYLVFGSGFGTFGNLVGKYEPSRLYYHFDHAHCDFLEFISELGLVGFSIIVVMCLVYAMIALKRFSRRHDPFVLGFSVGLFGALTAIFFHSFTEFNLRIPSQAILLSILLALLLNVLDLNRKLFNLNDLCDIHIPALRKFGFFKVTSGFFAIALAIFFIIFSCRPVMADYCHSRAIHGIKQKNLGIGSAIRLLQKAVRLDPMNAVYYAELGNIYDECKETKNALWMYQKAVFFDPANSKYYQSLAWSYGRKSRRNVHMTMAGRESGKLARLYFEKAISLEPRNPYRYRTYALWLFSLSEKEAVGQAIGLYGKAVRMDPALYREFAAKFPQYTSMLEKAGS